MDQSEKIIYQIYEAASDPEYWIPVCNDLATLVGAGSVHLLLADSDTGREYINLFAKGDPRFASEYLFDYAQADFRVPRVMARPLGGFADEREYVSDLDIRHSTIHQELLPRYDIHKISGANMSLPGCIGWFGVSAGNPAAELDGRQMSVLGRVSSHLLNAFKITRSQEDLNLTRGAAFAALDLVNVSLFLFDGDTLDYANTMARRLLEGNFFVIRHGALSCRMPAESRRLAQFLDLAASGHPTNSVLLRNRDDMAAYIVRIHEISPRYPQAGSRPSARKVVSIAELNISADNDLEAVEDFCFGYGVSPFEAKAVHAVLSSKNLAEFAEDRGVSLNTVQQQLKSAMAKMDLKSQKKIYQAFERYRLLQ